jgi:membrane AbrB-like protein
MPDINDKPKAEKMARLPAAAQWALIALVSIAVGAVLEFAGIPAALFLGPLAGGILGGVNGANVRVPRLAYQAAQAVIGVMIAEALNASIFSAFVQDWALFISVVGATVLASSVLGYLISRWRVLPGTTGVWGSSPGAATAMVLMAEAFGADAQLVAFMQYLRVIFVAAAAAIVARLFVGVSGSAGGIEWFPPIEPGPFASTIALVVLGGLIGAKLGVPAGVLLVPMIVGTVLHVAGVAYFQLPEWLLVLSYALIGWNIGLGFTRQIVRYAARALPQIALSIILLLAFCGGLALLLSRILGIDLLTAYLATSPGGMDSIAIIASASRQVDLPLVMALQSVRFFVVLFLGPPIARLVARRLKE